MPILLEATANINAANRSSVAALTVCLEELQKKSHAWDVWAVATTQEEIAYATGGGARTTAVGLDAQVAVVVDVTHATDHPGSDKKRHGDIKLGGGVVLSRGSAVNPVVFDRLVAAAERESIPYVVQAAPRYTGTDADAIYTAQRGVATGLVSVPNRYMHSPNEMVVLEDLERTARLLAAFAAGGVVVGWIAEDQREGPIADRTPQKVGRSQCPGIGARMRTLTARSAMARSSANSR